MGWDGLSYTAVTPRASLKSDANNSNAVNPTCPFRVIETVSETVMETVRKVANLIDLHWVIPYQALLCLLLIFDVTEARRVARVIGNLHVEDRCEPNQCGTYYM